MLKMTIDGRKAEETMRELRKSINAQVDAVVNAMGEARERLNAAVIESNLQARVEEIEAAWEMACESAVNVLERYHEID